jgi:flagellar protein FlaJ
MSFSESLRGLSTKAFSDKGSEFLSFDMLYQISYMSATAAAGISRPKIFEFACQLPCYTSRYFREVQALADKMRLDYAQACRKIGEVANDGPVSGFLLRWSASMASGEAEADFLAQEAKISAEAFENCYEREVDSLRMWTEAYAAIIISAALMVMVSSISMLIYPVATGMTMGIMGLTIATAIIGAWAIWKVAPKEIAYHVSTPFCPELTRARRLERILVPVSVIAFVGILAVGGGLGLALITGAIMLLPVGVAGIMYDRKVKKKDADIATLIRTTGNVASAVGITTSLALSKLDLRATSSLIQHIKDLQGRLSARLKPEQCWHRFSLETGSETVYRSVKMFQDATRLGGEPDDVAERSCLLAASLNFLRAKRGQVSSSFTMLAIGMHICIIGLLLFVVEVIMAFASAASGTYTEAVQGIESEALSVFSLNFQVIGILNVMTLPAILVLSITVAFAVKTAKGSSRHTFYTYLGTTLGATGLGLVIVPALANSLFAPITAF